MASMTRDGFRWWLAQCTSDVRLFTRQGGDGWMSQFCVDVLARSTGCPRRDSKGRPIGTGNPAVVVLATCCGRASVISPENEKAARRAAAALGRFERWLAEWLAERAAKAEQVSHT